MSGWPWPDRTDLGEFRGAQPFSRCVDCPQDYRGASSWVTYGGKPLCLSHALLRARRMNEAGA